MQPQTPYDFLRELKERMITEHKNLLSNKDAYSKKGDADMVRLYMIIEEKLVDFMDDLLHKKGK